MRTCGILRHIFRNLSPFAVSSLENLWRVIRLNIQWLALERSNLLRLQFNKQAAFSLVCTYKVQRTFFHSCIIKQATKTISLIEYLIKTSMSPAATGKRKNTRFKMLGFFPSLVCFESVNSLVSICAACSSRLWIICHFSWDARRLPSAERAAAQTRAALILGGDDISVWLCRYGNRRRFLHGGSW